MSLIIRFNILTGQKLFAIRSGGGLILMNLSTDDLFVRLSSRAIHSDRTAADVNCC